MHFLHGIPTSTEWKRRDSKLDLLRCTAHIPTRDSAALAASHALLGRFLPRLETVNPVGGLSFCAMDRAAA
jgi:hypothetical protein